jgi:hypothetical protein
MDESNTTRVQASQNSKGEFQLDIKVFPAFPAPGHPDIGLIISEVTTRFRDRIMATSTDSERSFISQEMSAAVNSAIAARITDHQDLLHREYEKAIESLPEKVAELADLTAQALQKRGFKVAGDDGTRLLTAAASAAKVAAPFAGASR